MHLLAGKFYGVVSLWLLGIGFAAYALWRLSEAVFGVTGEPPGAGPRLKSLARSVIYAGLAYLTFTVISGTDRSQSRRQQDMTATAMQHPVGRWVVGIAGLTIVICGLVLVVEGARKKFMKYLRTAQMSARMRHVVEMLGMTGTIARGLVFALVGVLVIDAAVTHKASESGGIDKALLTLRNQPFGEFLMLVAALGLVVFGIRPAVRSPLAESMSRTAGKQRPGTPELRKVLAEEGITDPLWHEVKKSRRAPEYARRAAARGVDVLFVWGGDGTVQRCIDAVAGTDTAVAILPAWTGTANLLATNLQIPDDLTGAVRIGLHADRRPVGHRVGERRALHGDGRRGDSTPG